MNANKTLQLSEPQHTIVQLSSNEADWLLISGNWRCMMGCHTHQFKATGRSWRTPGGNKIIEAYRRPLAPQQ